METGLSSMSTLTSICYLIFPALAAIGACLAALFTWRAARATAKANRGQTILTCLDKYISIVKDKSDAIERKDKRLAKDFYRELFDLHWSEFHLWHEGAIPNQVMRSWITVRRRNFNSDSIDYTSEDGTEHRISYADTWRDLKSTSYFEFTDPFVAFMDSVHSGDIDDIKQLKKKTKRKKA